MSKKLYLCVNCRSRIDSVDKALYVDQSTNRPFCSEKCIMDFHTPYMESFEREELERRHVFGLDREGDLDDYYNRHDLFQRALNGPDEVWFEKNPIGEEYHTHVTKLSLDGSDVYYILICSYFDDAPSFVFFKCLTRSKKLADQYKTGIPKDFSREAAVSTAAQTSVPDKVEEEKEPEVEIPQEALEDLELKKSEYLAGLLENRKDEDISFEEFGKYDEYLPLTIEDPDEIFTNEDEAGDEVRTYIKSFQAFGQDFFYVVICMKIAVKEPEDHEALLPVLCFPSTDQELYKGYAVGERISSILKN